MDWFQLPRVAALALALAVSTVPAFAAEPAPPPGGGPGDQAANYGPWHQPE
jgi:hypothetical protein